MPSQHGAFTFYLGDYLNVEGGLRALITWTATLAGAYRGEGPDERQPLVL
jgi:hypothetical protein